MTTSPAPTPGGPTGPADIATELLHLAGLGSESVDRVTFTGPATVLPSSFRVTDAAQALVAAVSVAAVDLAEQRSDSRTETSNRGAITVDARGSAAAFQSERHLVVRADDHSSSPALWDGLSGHYATADGHIQFHTNFPHHREALLTAVGCGPEADRDAVASVVAGWERFALEQRVAEVGGIAAALRTAEEWRQHPHCTHVANRPPLTVRPAERSGTTEVPDRWRDGEDRRRPLRGVRVLDFTRVIAGPVCTRTLAAFGADVLRVGGPGLPVVDAILPDTTLGKRFTDCDITTTAGRDTVLTLARNADVVVTGFRPGALAGHGLGVEQFLEANPDLVMASLSAFGPDGPWGGKRGFDSITQTATGVVATETEAFAEAKPRPLPCQLLDHGSGFLLALGVLAALQDRLRGGGGHLVETSLLTTRNWLEALGPADPGVGDGLADDDLRPFLAQRDSPYGRITHVRHPGAVEGISAHWERGPSRPGTDAPAWA